MFEKIGFRCLILTLIYFSAICTASPVKGRTYSVSKGEYPFHVSLSFTGDINDKESYFCSGTLISKKLVLTAEHCIRDLNKKNVMVIFDALDSGSGQVREIKSWITYEDWALSKLSPSDIRTRSAKYYEMMGTPDIYNNNSIVLSENDIAIIILSKKVMSVEPAKLTALHDFELIGQDVVTVGWGSANDSLKDNPDTLLQIHLKVLEHSEVKTNLQKLFKVDAYLDPHFLFTSSNPPAILSDGDSGGPLMLRSSKKLVGVNKGSSNIDISQISPYAMIRHVKLLDNYRKFIKDIESKSKQ